MASLVLVGIRNAFCQLIFCTKVSIMISRIRHSLFVNTLCIYLIIFMSSSSVLAQQFSLTGNRSISPSVVKSLEESMPPPQSMATGSPSIGVPALGSQFQVSGALVPEIKVHVLGDVVKPGIYSVPVTDRLSDVIGYASPKRLSQRVIEIRHSGEATHYYDLYHYYFLGDLSQNPFLKDNDVVFLPMRRDSIRIEGPVTRPGTYEIFWERSLKDALTLAGGLTAASSKAHPIKVIRFSEEGKQLTIDVESTLTKIKAFKIKGGDIVIVPDIVNHPKKFDYTVETLPGENLFYPTSTPNVFVAGSVGQAGAFPYKSHLKAGDYIAYASPMPQALLKSVVRIREGKRTRMRINDKPNPGDILIVKSRISVGTVVTTVSTALSLTLTTLLLREQLK